MKNTTQDNITNLILNQVKIHLDCLFDFENLSNREFKETYGYTKEQIKQVVKNHF